MTDDEIAKKISVQCGYMVAFHLAGRKGLAKLYAAHILRLIITHKDAVERWVSARRQTA